MGRLGEVAIFLALSGLLGMLHGTRAQYNGHWDNFEDYDEREYGFAEDEEEDYQEEDTEPEPEPEEASGDGEAPRARVLWDQELSPMCNNVSCWITGNLLRRTPGCLAYWASGLASENIETTTWMKGPPGPVVTRLSESLILVESQ